MTNHFISFRTPLASLFSMVLISILSCQHAPDKLRDEILLSSMGQRFKTEFELTIADFRQQIEKDSSREDAWLGIAEMQVILYIFGLSSREETIPKAKEAFEKASAFHTESAPYYTMKGILGFLDWDWLEARKAFLMAIEKNPSDPKPRHWYSLLLCAVTGDYETAMLQSDTIMKLRPSGEYQVGRGSLLYFARRNVELKDLMRETIQQDTSAPWGYDWLGMAYIELKDYKNSIATYQKAFQLADGLVEVGGGLGHALGLAGDYESAKKMANYYDMAAKKNYLPPVQRAFIHIGINEHEKALDLLEQAYAEKSWFIIFLKTEPWYDPIKDDPRFKYIINQMDFPDRMTFQSL